MNGACGCLLLLGSFSEYMCVHTYIHVTAPLSSLCTNDHVLLIGVRNVL